MSIEPGWYFARKKDSPVVWPIEVVRVSEWPGGGVVVWETGRSEPRMTADFEWGRVVYPEVENFT